MKRHIKLYAIIIPLLFTGEVKASALQEGKGDTITFYGIINEVAANHPLVKQSEKQVLSAGARINLAKIPYNTTAELSATYSHIGPVSEFTIPDLGSFSLFPSENYSASVNVNQMIYDFGKTGANVALETKGKEITELSTGQIKQKLSAAVAGDYFAALYIQKAINIIEIELSALKEHLAATTKRVSAGSATDYEVLTTQVKISNVENQRSDMLSSLNVYKSRLNLYMGRDKDSPLILADINDFPADLNSDEILIDKALSDREEIQIARKRAGLTELKEGLADKQNNPVISAFAAGGVKNGYVPELNKPKLNYSAGIGFKMPILDGHRSKYTKQQLAAELESDKAEIESVERNIINEVTECRANVALSLKKLKQSEFQLLQAKRAYELAKTRFSAGTITNLELLDSSTSLADSELTVTKSKIDYYLYSVKLRLVTGEKLWK